MIGFFVIAGILFLFPIVFMIKIFSISRKQEDIIRTLARIQRILESDRSTRPKPAPAPLERSAFPEPMTADAPKPVNSPQVIPAGEPLLIPRTSDTEPAPAPEAYKPLDPAPDSLCQEEQPAPAQPETPGQVPECVGSPVIPEPAHRDEKLPAPPAGPFRPSIPAQPGSFELALQRLMSRIWNWILVGADKRPDGVSMEYALATNWLLRVGIVILVAAIGFFLKYSVQRELIGPMGRVTLSLLAGAGMIAAGVRVLGKQYHLLGQGFLGGGIAALYFSVFAASQYYHLISAGHAFALMFLVTVFSGGLSVRYDSMLIAILGILGGYGTPVMLSTGQVQFIGLFSYMVLLVCGVFGISHWKQWHILNILCFFCTYVLFFAAMERHYTREHFWQVMPFLTVFFILFSTMIFIYNVVHRRPSTGIELFGLIANAGICFGSAYAMIADRFGREWIAVLTLGLATFYIFHVHFFLTRKIHDRNLLTIFIGLSAFFTVITFPLILSGSWITVSWAVLACIMLWMSGKLNSEWLRQISYLVYLIMFGRFFLLDLATHYGIHGDSGMRIGSYLSRLLERIMTAGIPIASLWVGFRISRREPAPASISVRQEDNTRAVVSKNTSAMAMIVLAILMLFVFLNMETSRTLRYFYDPLRLPALSVIWVTMCLFLSLLHIRNPNPILFFLVTVFTVGTVGKLMFIDLFSWNVGFGNGIAYREYLFSGALMRLLDFGAIIAFLYWAHSQFRNRMDMRRFGLALGYAGLALLFLFLSLELNSFLRIFIPGLRAGGISILWSLFALQLILSGIRNSAKPLRYIGLFLFVIVAIKVFFFDLAHLDQIYRIIAFAILGALLLSGSFLYLKYRHAFVVQKEESP